MAVDVTHWSGEGAFTQVIIDRLNRVESIAFLRVEDAPATRSEADYGFISNEIFVAFATRSIRQPIRHFGFWPGVRVVSSKAMSVVDLELLLTETPEIGAPDYADDAMLQYLRSERIVQPYQTRGYKLVELVRIYEVGTEPRR
jgi:hypothetical protein